MFRALAARLITHCLCNRTLEELDHLLKEPDGA